MNEEQVAKEKRPVWKTVLVTAAFLLVAGMGIYAGNDIITKAGFEGSAATLIQDDVVSADSVEQAAQCIDVILGLRSQDSTDIKAALCTVSDIADNTAALKDTLSVVLKDEAGARTLILSIVRQLNQMYTPGEGEEQLRHVLTLLSEALHEAAKNN